MKSFMFLCAGFILFISGIQVHGAELSQTQKDKAHQYIMECMKQTGVKPEVLAEAKKGNFKNDEALQKFTLCFFQKSGIVDNDGKVNLDVALSKLPSGVDKTEAKTLLQDCKEKSGKNAAETAFEIFKCYSHGTKTHILV